MEVNKEVELKIALSTNKESRLRHTKGPAQHLFTITVPMVPTQEAIPEEGG